MNTLTLDEVKAIYAAQVAHPLKDSAGWDARQSTRVEVHAELQRRNPMPCSSITPEMQAARDRRTPLTYAEREAQLAHQKAQVSDEQHRAYHEARASRHPHVHDASGKVVVESAHHHVQKLHGVALWTETDRLVGEAVSS